METHIVFIHSNNSEYLGYSMRQAKATNPNSGIHLIGDHSNDVYDFIEHYDIGDYNQSALEFEKVYKHWDSPSRRGFILYDIKRWFILNEFVSSKNIDKCLYVDSDVMIFCNVEKEFEELELKQWSFTVGETFPGDLAMHGSPGFWNNIKALDDFCKFVMDIYTEKDPENYDKAVNHYKNRLARGLKGGVCDMTMFALFEKSGRFRGYHVENIVNESTHDLHHGISTNGAFQYRKEGGIKKLKWVNSCPYGTEIKSGRKIRFKTMHYQGIAKKLMKGFYERS